MLYSWPSKKLSIAGRIRIWLVPGSANTGGRLSGDLWKLDIKGECSEPNAKDSELVRREINEMREALDAFKSAVEAEEVTGFKDGGDECAWRVGIQLRGCQFSGFV
jgi:hypothetical protein